MYVCLCAAVTHDELQACLRAGADTVGSIGDRCAAGTGCGACHTRLEGLLQAHRCRAATEPGDAGDALPRSA